MVIFTFASDTGRVRETNEDAFGHYVDEFFLVADGLGGLPAGEIAARLAIKTAINVYKKGKDIKQALEAANKEIYRLSQKDPTYFGMATTLVGAAVKGESVFIANVGDSRAYLVASEKISQISIDHGLGMGIVTRALGDDPKVKVDIFKKEFKRGDLLLLCTDGLTNTLSDEQIVSILNDVGRTKRELVQKAKQLMVETNQAGGFDNVTVCLVKRV